MTYSPLTNKYIPASPSNYSQGRAGNRVVKITPHHMAGNLSIETCGGLWQTAGRNASSNYGIGTDGRIGCYVQEENRSWCSSSAANDNVAITIEVANDGGANTNWHVSDTAINSLINLMVDICKRYGIKKMNFTGNANGNLTLHKYFASTVCPGPYLESKMPWIADQVNKKLNGDDKPKLTWTKLDKPVDYLCRLQPTTLWDFNHKDWNSCVAIKKFNKGDQITIYGKVYNDSLKATYLLTEYSYTNKITNGFNEYDMEKKPDPTPPAPELKWENTETTEYITKDGTKLYEVKTGKVVKDYKAGEEIPTVQKATWNNEEYVRTEYSKEKNIDNGFKLSELEKKPEPTPPTPEPEPEWTDVELKKYVAEVDTALYDVKTLEAIKEYKKGEEVEIAQKCTYKDTEWGRTEYSKEKNLNNGFIMDDFKEYSPSPEPDPTIGILEKIIAFIQHIIDLITGKK